MEYQETTTEDEKRPLFFDLETTGLNPMIEPWYNGQASEVTAIGVGSFDNGRVVQSFINRGDMEYEIIKAAIDWFALHDVIGTDTFRVGWNIKQFDDPYLGARAARLNQDACPLFRHRRLDMMRALTIPKGWWGTHDHDGKNRNYPKQDDYARYLGVDFIEGLTGKEMPEAFAEGRYDEIEEHVIDDMETMMDIYEKEEDELIAHYTNHYNLGDD